RARRRGAARGGRRGRVRGRPAVRPAAGPHGAPEASTVSEPTNIARTIQEVAEKAAVLVREEIELAKAEVAEKAGKIARGAVVAAAAGAFVLGALVMLLSGFAEPVWCAVPFPATQKFWA